MIIKLIKWLSIGIIGLVALAFAVLLLAPGIHLSSLTMILNVATGSGSNTPSDELMERLQVQDGYHLSVFARDLGNPRMLELTAGNTLLYSSPREGTIVQLRDSNKDGRADQRTDLLQGLLRPHGLEVHEGYLYVAESNQVGRIAYDADSGTISGEYEVVIPGLTDDGNHWSKTIRIKDDWLYVSMGSTCNVCEETDSRRASITRYRLNGSGEQIFASGLRNSVGMDFAPWNGNLFATDNGRDLLGDDYPPCELNEIVEGGFYGWPYLNGDNDLDPDFGAGKEALQATAIKPVLPFRAHNAPLGIHFSTEKERLALVALHGSWNRTTPDGYKVLALEWDSRNEISASDFLWGFEDDGNIIGRPVDISSDGKGGYFVSDDYAQVIYRVSPHQDLVSTAEPEAGTAQDSPLTAAGEDVVAQVIDPGFALAGELLYRNLPCGDCHNADSATPVVLEHLGEKYDLESLANYFLTPTPPMPRYELNADQRQQLAHFLLSREQAPAGK